MAVDSHPPSCCSSVMRPPARDASVAAPRRVLCPVSPGWPTSSPHKAICRPTPVRIGAPGWGNFPIGGAVRIAAPEMLPAGVDIQPIGRLVDQDTGRKQVPRVTVAEPVGSNVSTGR